MRDAEDRLAKIPENMDDLRIVTYPHPGLRELAAPLADPTDPKLARLADKMRDLLRQADGVGLAATQLAVGVRMLLANPTREPGKELVVINPEVVETEGWQDTEEGCLSLPGITVKLRRRKRVKVRYFDLAGQAREVDASGLLATVFQHEGDHLDGRLIIDRAGLIGRLTHRDALKRMEAEFAAQTAR